MVLFILSIVLFHKVGHHFIVNDHKPFNRLFNDAPALLNDAPLFKCKIRTQRVNSQVVFCVIQWDEIFSLVQDTFFLFALEISSL